MTRVKGFNGEPRGAIALASAFQVERKPAYTVKTAAVLLSKGESAVRKLIQRERIHATRTPDGGVYVPHEEIARFLGIAPTWN